MGALAATDTETGGHGLPPGFRELYADHYDFLWRCALRLGAPPADVEDLVQETFVIALRRYDPQALAGRARASTWLFAILHNVLRNHARGERRRRARLDEIALIDEGEHARERADQSLGVRLLDEFLTELDPDHRSVFVLSEVEGMRGPEIARALGLNANTARSRLRTARQAFRARFDHENESMVAEAGEVRAPMAARARTLAVLAVPVKAIGWASVGSLVGVKVLLGASLTLGLGFAGVTAWQQRSATTSQPRSERAPVEAELGTKGEPGATDEPKLPATEVAIESIVVTPTLAPEPKRPAKSQDELSDALASLASARESLAAGDAAACLAELEAARWPASLQPRKVALELGALCMLGQTDTAQARARAFRDAHPDLASAIDVDAPCANAKSANASQVGGQTRP